MNNLNLPSFSRGKTVEFTNEFPAMVMGAKEEAEDSNR